MELCCAPLNLSLKGFQTPVEEIRISQLRALRAKQILQIEALQASADQVKLFTKQCV